jgi:hypothetical protein
VACANDVRPTEDPLGTAGGNSSDPGVDGGLKTDGGSSTTVADARVPPPDGIPQGLAPCDEAVYHSDFQFVQEKIFNVSCATSGCHTGATPDAQMSLDAGRAWGALVNVPSSTHTGWTRVVPGNSGASMLMVQVGGEPGPELEGFMPWGDPRLCDPLVDAMRRWIASGAPQQ